jgi:hypothetical protein
MGLRAAAGSTSGALIAALIKAYLVLREKRELFRF